MLQGRSIRKSASDHITELFESPPTESGLSPFTVYTETQYRDTTFVPPSNTAFVFIVSARTLPATETKYPVIVVDLPDRKWAGQEMGNTNGGVVTVDFNCFGRNSGESNDMADFIARFFGRTLPVKDYSSSNPTGSVIEQATVLEPIEIDAMAVEEQSVQFSGAVLSWDRVRMKIMTLQ